jgi:hypothetical protein
LQYRHRLIHEYVQVVRKIGGAASLDTAPLVLFRHILLPLTLPGILPRSGRPDSVFHPVRSRS